MRRTALIIVIVVLGWSALVAGRAPEQPGGSGVVGPATPGGPVPGAPPPEAASSLRSGTAMIRGRVVALDTGLPLRLAQVSLRAAGSSRSRLTLTDDQGRFEFGDLPAAEYTVGAGKHGYIDLSYGQRQPSEPRQPIDVADGATVDDITLRLPRGGVIAGLVVDQYGEPVVGAQVEAQRQANGEPVRTYSTTTSVASRSGTDDQGAFRIFGLLPGDYVVKASLNQSPGTTTEQIELSTVSVPTYYPGTPSAAFAQPVSVGLSEVSVGLVVPLVEARTAAIAGQVVDAAGRPYPQVRLMLREGTNSRDIGVSGLDGTFLVTGVPPGAYHVDAIARATARSRTDMDAGMVDVSVAGEDISGLVIVATNGVTVKGRIVGANGRPPEGLGTSAVSIRTEGVPAGALFGSGTPTIADDWTFELAHVQGRRLLRVTTPQAWTVRRILRAGEDVIDTPIDFSREAVDDVVIELTRNLTSLSGMVRDARGAPIDGAVVVIFAEDPDRWAPPSRFIRTVRPDRDGGGAFQTRGLPPGTYLAVAVDRLESGLATNPSVLERLRRSGAAVRVSLREGESASVELRLLETF